MKFVLSTLVLCLFVLSQLVAQSISTTKRELINKFFEVINAKALINNSVIRTIEQFKKNDPSIPQGYYDLFQKEFDVNACLNSLVPVYDKHLTESELVDVVNYYSTPTGKKIASLMPTLQNEISAASIIEVKAASKRAMEKLRYGK